MKRLITFFAVVAFAGQAWAGYFTFKVDSLYYSITSDSTAEVVSSSMSISDNYWGVTSAEILSTVEYDGVTYMVTSIDRYAFNHCGSLKSVVIPNSVTSIGEAAFFECNSLTTVVIPGSVKNIHKQAFCQCANLSSVTMESGLTTIGEGAFQNCTKLTSVIIPNSVKNIEDDAFFNCRLESITLPDSLTIIGNSAFYGNKIDSLIIPNSVKSIGSEAFYNCYDLKFVIIGDSVESIGDRAFFQCFDLSSVVFGKSVSYVGEDAFRRSLNGRFPLTKAEYSSIESFFRIKNAPTTEHLYVAGKEITDLVVPNFVTTIDSCAFYSIYSLTSVIIGDSVESIGYGAFRYCSNLASVTFGKSLKSIGSFAFCGCRSLKSINISDAVTKIDTSAFDGCNITSAVIPNSVDTIGPYAFYLAKNIVYSGNAEGSPWGALTVNGIIDGDYVYSDAEKTNLTAYIGNEENVVIPETVTSIGIYAFRGCGNITTITIPITVDSIGPYAFDGCTATINCMVEKRPNGWNKNWCGDGFEGKIVWKKTTPITESAANAVNIYAYGRNIVVENAAEEISVYDVMGRLVCRDVPWRVSTINVNGTGVYIVKVGNIAKRVVISQK